MAQFDVYINPSKTSRVRYPFVVDIQSPVIAELATRIVLPLGKASAFGNKALNRLTPQITYQDENLLLLTPQIAAIPAKLLSKPVGSLKHFREEILASVDFAITGF